MIGDGDVAALGVLFDQSARQVYSLVMQLVRNHDIAEDIVESTFWQAWQEAGLLAEHPEPRAWLLSTGRRRALDHLRGRRRQRDELLNDKRQFEDLVTNSASESASDESQQLFQRALRNLAPDERQVLEFGYFRGLSQVEMCDLIGESAPVIRARLRSALSELRARPGEAAVSE